MLSAQGFYRQPRISTRLSVMMLVVRASMFTVLGTILVMFFLRADFARSVIILVGAVGGFLVYLRHEIVQWSNGDAPVAVSGFMARHGSRERSSPAIPHQHGA